MTVADVNHDHKQDLVIFDSPTDGSPGTVFVLLGKGDGTFESEKKFGISSFPSVVAFGDFDGDGHLDMVVANTGNTDPLAPASLLTLKGNGDGTFQKAGAIFAGSLPFSGSDSLKLRDQQAAC